MFPRHACVCLGQQHACLEEEEEEEEVEEEVDEVE